MICQNIIVKEKLNENRVHEKTKEWKNFIRKVFQDSLYLFRANSGLLAKYLTANLVLNSIVIQPQDARLPTVVMLRVNLMREVFQLLSLAFSFSSNYSCLLSEETASFYLKYSFTNFVKLYGHSTANELNEISSKIKEINQRKGDHNLNGDNLREMLRKEERAHVGAGAHREAAGNAAENKIEGYYRQIKINLMTSYVGVLFALSTVRTDDISQRISSYRIIEFFAREIDLEFSIHQTRERFIQINRETKEKQQQKSSEDSGMSQALRQQLLLQGAHHLDKGQPSPPVSSANVTQPDLERAAFAKGKPKVPLLRLNKSIDDEPHPQLSQGAQQGFKQDFKQDAQQDFKQGFKQDAQQDFQPPVDSCSALQAQGPGKEEPEKPPLKRVQVPKLNFGSNIQARKETLAHQAPNASAGTNQGAPSLQAGGESKKRVPASGGPQKEHKRSVSNIEQITLQQQMSQGANSGHADRFVGQKGAGQAYMPFLQVGQPPNAGGNKRRMNLSTISQQPACVQINEESLTNSDAGE